LQEFRYERRYQGKIKGVILDWAGTTLDCGVYSPAVVFIDVFKKHGVNITMEEAREPMGQHKRVHIQRITEMDSVRAKWRAVYNRDPTIADVDKMFHDFQPMQIAVLDQYSGMITGAVDTVKKLQKDGLKIGSTTGFTKAMVDVLLTAARKQGYHPDNTVAADEVPAARPYPYMVWQNAIALSISPIEAIVKVDDTMDGVHEGTNAGCWSVGLAKTGNYIGLNEKEIAALPPADYKRKLAAAYEKLSRAGAHYVIDDITGLPAVIDHINARLARGDRP
jgi:phosphonoacetaldehyde hydrolase